MPHPSAASLTGAREARVPRLSPGCCSRVCCSASGPHHSAVCSPRINTLWDGTLTATVYNGTNPEIFNVNPIIYLLLTRAVYQSKIHLKRSMPPISVYILLEKGLKGFLLFPHHSQAVLFFSLFEQATVIISSSSGITNSHFVGISQNSRSLLLSNFLLFKYFIILTRHVLKQHSSPDTNI